MSQESHSLYPFKHHPDTCDPDDIWGQVKRTVGGKVVAQEQIDLILNAIRAGLELANDDVLLDLCCGNGGLTHQLFRDCRGGVGVDYSSFLIDVANRRFSGLGQRYLVSDALDYLGEEPHPEVFTKVLCYGALSYFTPEATIELLSMVRRRFASANRFFIGNMPDKARIAAYYKPGNLQPGEENNPAAAIGIWRTKEEFASVAAKAGWAARFHFQPPSFYAHHYRYDVVLSPLSGDYG